MKTSLSIIILFLFSACASKHSLTVKSNKYAYGISEIKSPWQQISSKKADFYFVHNKFPSVHLYFKGQCNNVKDSNLDVLTAQLLIDFTKIKYFSKEEKIIEDRYALISHLSADLDGQKIFLSTMVLRKNLCVFDSIMISTEENDEAKADFLSFLNNLWVKVAI